MSPSRLLKALAPQKGAWRGPNCQKSVLGSPDGNLMLSYLISYCLSLYQILFRKDKIIHSSFKKNIFCITTDLAYRAGIGFCIYKII